MNNLLQIYEALESLWEMELLLEHNSTQRSRINKLSNDIMRDWLNWVKQKMQSKKLPWLAGLNFNNNYHCVLGFFLLIKNELEKETPIKEIQENNKFSQTYPIDGQKIPFVIWPGDDSGKQGMTHHKDNPVWIEININNFDECLEDVFGTTEINETNTEPLKVDPIKANKALRFYLIYRRSVITHETQHYFQNIIKWKDHKTALDYSIANDMGLSVFGNLMYLTTPQEVEANITGANRIYRYYHHQLDIIEAIFVLYAQNHEHKVLNKFLADDLSCYKDIYDIFPDLFFVFAWIIYYYIPKKSNKQWLIGLVNDALPKHEAVFKKYNIMPDEKIVRKNATNLFKFVRAIRHDERFYPVLDTLNDIIEKGILNSPEEKARLKALVDCISDEDEKDEKIGEEVQKKLTETYKRLFSVNQPNDSEISEILSIYQDNVKEKDESGIYKKSVDRGEFFPDQTGLIARFCHKKGAERIFNDAVMKTANPDCPNLLAALYDLCVLFNRDKFVRPNSYIWNAVFKKLLDERPARTFLFLYMVFYFIPTYHPEWLPFLNIKPYRKEFDACSLASNSVPYRNRAAYIRRWFRKARKTASSDPTSSLLFNAYMTQHPNHQKAFFFKNIIPKKLLDTSLDDDEN